MCDKENVNNSCECLYKILKQIINLQDQDYPCDDFSGCDKPYLGPTPSIVCYNTRPISFYNCITGNLWSMPYTLNGKTNYSTLFRIESLDECCCTCRILYTDSETKEVTATKEFFTINLNCVSAIKCSNDVYVDLCL